MPRSSKADTKATATADAVAQAERDEETRKAALAAKASEQPATVESKAGETKTVAVTDTEGTTREVEIAVPAEDPAEITGGTVTPTVTTNVRQANEPGKDEPHGDTVAVAVPVPPPAPPFPADPRDGSAVPQAPPIPPAPPMPIPPNVEQVHVEAPFGSLPGDLDEEDVDEARASLDTGPGVEVSDRARMSTVTYEGLRGDSAGFGPDVVSIIVPEDASTEDYEALITTGTGYTFRLGKPTRVLARHVKWLEGYPAYSIKGA